MKLSIATTTYDRLIAEQQGAKAQTLATQMADQLTKALHNARQTANRKLQGQLAEQVQAWQQREQAAKALALTQPVTWMQELSSAFQAGRTEVNTSLQHYTQKGESFAAICERVKGSLKKPAKDSCRSNIFTRLTSLCIAAEGVRDDWYAERSSQVHHVIMDMAKLVGYIQASVAYVKAQGGDVVPLNGATSLAKRAITLARTLAAEYDRTQALDLQCEYCGKSLTDVPGHWEGTPCHHQQMAQQQA